MIHVERDRHGWVHLTGTDLDTFLTLRLEAPQQIGSPAKCLVPFTELQKLGKTCPADETLDLEVLAEDKLLLRHRIGSHPVEQVITGRTRGRTSPRPPQITAKVLSAWMKRPAPRCSTPWPAPATTRPGSSSTARTSTCPSRRPLRRGHGWPAPVCQQQPASGAAFLRPDPRSPLPLVERLRQGRPVEARRAGSHQGQGRLSPTGKPPLDVRHQADRGHVPQLAQHHRRCPRVHRHHRGQRSAAEAIGRIVPRLPGDDTPNHTVGLYTVSGQALPARLQQGPGAGHRSRGARRHDQR